MAAQRADVREDIAALRAEIREDSAAMRGEFREGQQALRADLQADLRTLVLQLAGFTVAVATIAVAIVKLA